MSTMNIFDMTDTWNAGGTTFVGIKLNATDTASAAGSLLMDLQVGGVSRTSVNKSGSLGSTIVVAAAPATMFAIGMFTPDAGVLRFARSNNALPTFTPINTVADLAYDGTNFYLDLVNTGSSLRIGNDTRLFRDAANTLAQRNGVNAQAFGVYGTFTDASNSRRLVMTMSAAGVAAIRPEGLGTGATGNVLHISGLPTANPGPGILWNSSGSVVVGT